MNEPASIHVPVMLAEVLEWLRPQAGQTFLDGTLGGGGHTRALSERVGAQGLVVALDRDEVALERASQNLRGLPVKLVHESFRAPKAALQAAGVESVNGAVLDLGLSSDQLADGLRGFSYESSALLDLRFDFESGEPAWRLLQRLTERELADLIYQFGEERHSRRIARRIVERRNSAPLKLASELAELVRSCVPRARHHRIDPATRTFQALRIAVNDELGALADALQALPGCLAADGRLVVISFHSLEDRLVKRAMRDDPRLMILTKKPIRPTEREVADNPRSRSAKLRAAARTQPEP